MNLSSRKEKVKLDEISNRKDALTKKPLNFRKEEKTRQLETDRWLQQHFGSTEQPTFLRNKSVSITSRSRDSNHIYSKDAFKNEQFSR